MAMLPPITFGCGASGYYYTWWALLLVLFLVPFTSELLHRTPIHPGHRFQECGGIFNQSRGFFHTPNFPGPFPVPISCRWVIEAPRGKNIMLHFTQFYLREGVRAKAFMDYNKFWGRTDVGEHDLGEVSADNKTTRLTTILPFLVLDLEVDDLTNTNIRVLDSFMEVYGFNVTYEMVDEGAKPKNVCSVSVCTFNGNCYGSADLQRYSCQCFPDFYGDRCQYGPDCDPARGKDSCRNGGTCRYIVGSRVYACNCPEGFAGANCEYRDNYNNKDCQSLKCSQLCKHENDSTVRCDCNPGFHLASNNRTCVSSGLTRYIASIKLRNASFVPTSSDKSSQEYIRLKNNIESKLTTLLSTKVKQMKNVTVLQFRPGAVVDFHFFGAENESNLAQEALRQGRQSGRIGNIPVDSSHISFEQEQAVNIQTLKVEPRDQLIVGQELRLACVTLGSSALKFHWLKDGAEVNIYGSGGNIWQRLLPKTVKDEYTAILGIGRVELAHTGAYTCRVSDWGQTQESVVTVSVLTPPEVLVSPLTITVNQGDEVSILCLSHIYRNNKFGYNWAKNGKIIALTEGPEILEDVFPTGSRVKIPRADSSATYSCIVSGMTGETKVDSRVTVINPNVVQVCPAEEHLGIHWNRSAPNAYHITQCPMGFHGDVRRRCTKLDKRPFWEEPDFSDCRSPTMVKLRSRFENLRVGFLVTTSTKVLEDIYTHITTRGVKLWPGEADSILELIGDVLRFQEKHQPLSRSEVVADGTDVFFNIMSYLLTSPKAINSERMVLQLIQDVQRRALYLARGLPIGRSLKIDKDSLAVDIVCQPLTNAHNIFVPVRRIKRGQNDWTTDSIMAKVDFAFEEKQFPRKYKPTIDFAVIFYKNISQLLPKRSSLKWDVHSHFMDMEYELNSKLVTVAYHVDAPQNAVRKRENHVTMYFNQTSWEVQRRGWNVTCGMANVSLGKLEWSVDDCSLITVENVTSCLCTRFGTYVVLLTTFLTSGDDEFKGRLDTIVAIGCFVGLVLIFLALISLAVCWRNVFRSFTVLKIQVCIGLLGVMVTLLAPVQVSLPPSAYPFVLTLLEFFFLEPLSMHVCLELFLYLELANLRHIRHPIAKIVLLGWGIPTIVTVATVIAQAQDGFNLDRWWMKVGDTYFYSFTISASILLALYMLLYLVVYLELQYKVIDDESPQQASALKKMGLLKRSLVLQLFETAVAITSIIYSNSPNQVHQYLFAITCGITGFLVFLLYTIQSESPGRICSKRNLDTKSSGGTASSTRSNTASSFLKLDGHPDSLPLNNRLDCDGECKKLRRMKGHLGEHLHHHHHRHHHCILRGESREMEDLLHEVVTSNQNNCNSLVSVEKDGTRESYLEHLEETVKMKHDNNIGKVINLNSNGGRLLSNTQQFSNEYTHGGSIVPLSPIKNRVNISIVDYDGSPKKYPYTKETTDGSGGGDGEEEEELWPLPPPPMLSSDMPRPEPGKCYIRSSPDTSLPRESPTSSATSVDVSSSSSGLKPAQVYHNTTHQVPFCYHVEPRSAILSPSRTRRSPLADVPPRFHDGVTVSKPPYGVTVGNDQHQLVKRGSVSGGSVGSPIIPSGVVLNNANYVNQPVDHRNTVV